MIRANIGCGPNPLHRWYNYDNSISVSFANHKALAFILDKFGLFNPNQKNFIHVAKNNKIFWADVTKHIPLPDSSVEVLYSSHMVEHLDREEVKLFLKESHRVLTTNGIIRIAVPCLQKLANQYINDGDADYFLEKILLKRRRPKTFLESLKYLIIGERLHQWMYDGSSLIRLLSSMDFKGAREMKPGLTLISDPGALNLYERHEESVYVEARKP